MDQYDWELIGGRAEGVEKARAIRLGSNKRDFRRKI